MVQQNADEVSFSFKHRVLKNAAITVRSSAGHLCGKDLKKMEDEVDLFFSSPTLETMSQGAC